MLQKFVDARNRVKELIRAAQVRCQEANDEFKRLRAMEAELEACEYLIGKYQSFESIPAETAEALIADRGNLIENFEQKFKPLIDDNVRLLSQQLNNVGKEVLTREQMAKQIDLYAKDVKDYVATKDPSVVPLIDEADKAVRVV